MKYCPRCEGLFDDRMSVCPMCDSPLETADEKTLERIEDRIKNGYENKRDKKEILLCVLLAVVAFAEIISCILGYAEIKTAVIMTLVNCALIIAVIFKQFFFSHFTFQSLAARKNGQDVNKLMPVRSYVVMQKVGLLLWALVCIYIVVASFVKT